MNKRVISISNPYHLSVRHNQLVLMAKDTEVNGTPQEKQVPVEDLGCVILEHPQITMTMKLAQELSAQNVAVIFCDEKYMPSSMLFHLDTLYTAGEIYGTDRSLCSFKKTFVAANSKSENMESVAVTGANR